MHCQNCGEELKTSTQKKFCSTSCAATFNNKRFIKRKKSPSICDWCGEIFIPGKRTFGKFCCLDCANTFTRLTSLNKRLVEYICEGKHIRFGKITINGNFCERCGCNEWMGKDIPLELHHKNGDNSETTKSNTELICPNCHAQTKNYRGKNVKAKKPQYVSDLELREAVESSPNIRQALIKVGLAPKGANYKRAKNAVVVEWNTQEV